MVAEEHETCSSTVKLRKLRFHPLRLGQRLTLRPPGTSRHLVFGQASANP